MTDRKKVEKVYRKLGKLIATHRTAAGVTQTELAKLIKISRPALANMEMGRQRILVHHILKIEKAFGLPCSTLIAELAGMVK